MLRTYSPPFSSFHGVLSVNAFACGLQIFNTENTEKRGENRRVLGMLAELRFPRGADMHFADEAADGLRDKGGHGVRDILRLQGFRRIFLALARKFRGH